MMMGRMNRMGSSRWIFLRSVDFSRGASGFSPLIDK